MNTFADKILSSRRALVNDLPVFRRAEDAAEGGCGVLGFAANLPIHGRHVLSASRQMHNRGNGKGGGIAMAGLDPLQVGVDKQTLRTHYMIQIALLDPGARIEIERQFLDPYFDLAAAYELEHVEDYRMVVELEVRPPDVWRYFGRVKPAVLAEFATRNDLEQFTERSVEDEFVYQNTFALNRQFYASLGEKRGFVLSHGRNLSVLKIVGYAEQVVEYYGLEDQSAHVWIAHQRYPTKGRVWHSGGAHPFIGLNEALVHNGDFANYHAVSEYLRQRNIGQLFLTDTEVSVQLFDLWDRVYRYPLETTLEAMAPTSEYDFAMLPTQKQALYRAIQRTNIHGSPDGPWFFIVARSLPGSDRDEPDRFELLGITDTSMLRPQVFALYENQLPLPEHGLEHIQIGLIASERQAINACLRSLAAEDPGFQPVADRYWVARGGSHTDGGAFQFSVTLPSDADSYLGANLSCVNKFGQPVSLESGRDQVDRSRLDPLLASPDFQTTFSSIALHAFDNGGVNSLWKWLKGQMPQCSWNDLAWGISWLKEFGNKGDLEWKYCTGTFNTLRDRRYDTGFKKRASIVTLIDQAIGSLFDDLRAVTPHDCSHHSFDGDEVNSLKLQRLTWQSRHDLCAPDHDDSVLVIDSQDFPPEGEEAAARWIVNASTLGWTWIIAYNWRGGRFAGCGLGPKSGGLRIDLYGDVGDYAASGLDGAEVHIHGDGQDQLGQIFKRGKLVIHGDVGQTFLYGAKGGEIFVLGSAAGRPLINAVGKPRAVINGTCLDYLAESFMAGDPHAGGGFIILNGVTFDEAGRLVELESPYPGGNLFSLASGGAIYIRDPHKRVVDEQLNGGAFVQLSEADWELIEPYLAENERLFDIRLAELLTVDGHLLSPLEVYRKVEVRNSTVLREGENR